MKDAPIENFKPPAAAEYKDVLTWEYKVTELQEKIRKLKIGSEKLREIIRAEVRDLKLFRFQLFCQYY